MSARSLWKHAFLAGLLHLALLALWPVVRFAYAPAFRVLMELAVNVVDPLPGPITVRFEPGSGGPLARDVVRMDTVVRLQHRELQGGDATFGASSFFHAYLPTTVLLALFGAAAGRSWRARRRPLTWAMLLLHVFVVARCVLALFYTLGKSTIEGQPVLDLGPTGQRVLHLLWHFGWEEMLVEYLVPLLIFGLCMFGPRSSAAVEP